MFGSLLFQGFTTRGTLKIFHGAESRGNYSGSWAPATMRVTRVRGRKRGI
jgi:hypothetical protein